MKKYFVNKIKSSYRPDIADEIAESVSEDMNLGLFENLESCIDYEIQRAMFKSRDRWDLMRSYQQPEEANYERAEEELKLDVFAIIEQEEVK